MDSDIGMKEIWKNSKDTNKEDKNFIYYVPFL